MVKQWLIVYVCVVITIAVQYFWSKKKYPNEQDLSYRAASIIYGSTMAFIGLLIYIPAESAVSRKWADLSTHNPWIILMWCILVLIGLFLITCGLFEVLNIFVYTVVLHSRIEEEQRIIKRMTETYRFLYGAEPENEDIKNLLSDLEQKNQIEVNWHDWHM